MSDSAICVPLAEIEDIVERFHIPDEERVVDFTEIVNASGDYFVAFGEGEINSYKQLIRFLQKNATRNPLDDEIRAAYDYEPGDFFRHLESLKTIWERENKSLLSQLNKPSGQLSNGTYKGQSHLLS